MLQGNSAVQRPVVGLLHGAAARDQLLLPAAHFSISLGSFFSRVSRQDWAVARVTPMELANAPYEPPCAACWRTAASRAPSSRLSSPVGP